MISTPDTTPYKDRIINVLTGFGLSETGHLEDLSVKARREFNRSLEPIIGYEARRYRQGHAPLADRLRSMGIRVDSPKIALSEDQYRKQAINLIYVVIGMYLLQQERKSILEKQATT